MYMALLESLSWLSLVTSDRWQHVEIDSSFSCCLKLTQGVSQGSVLESLLLIST